MSEKRDRHPGSFFVRGEKAKRARKRRDVRIDNVRGVLILLVVIGHFLLPFERTRLVTNLIFVIYSFHMPCFILISGFYAKSVYRDGRFRYGKILQFLWLYFIFKLLTGLTEGLLSGNIPIIPDLLHESGAPWYLLALSIWYLTLPLFERLRCRPLLSACALCAVLLLVVFGKYFVFCKDFLSIDRVLSFAPFFYLGYFLPKERLAAYVRSDWRRLTDALSFALLLILFFCSYDVLYPFRLVIYGAQYTRYDASLWDWLWLINLIWYGAALTLSLGLIGMMPGRRLPVLTMLGQRTLQIYMLHRPIRDLMEYAGFYEQFSAHNKASVALAVLFAVLITLFLGTRPVSFLFGWIRTAPDSLLKKCGAV